MADEVGSAALSTGQKAIEVSAELIKMLAPLIEKLIKEVYQKSVDGLTDVGEKISEIRSKGTVSNKGLFVEAHKANCGISTTNNILERDISTFAEKAKQYNIPIAVVGNGEKQTIEFLDRDKGVIEQITQEIMQERLKEAPQSVKCFTVSEHNVTAMKAAFEENGIECQFMKAADGKIKCVYPAENAEQVAVIKNDYKRIYNEVAENCSVIANVPETERQAEISARIDELTNAEIGSEQRSEVYKNILSDMQSREVEIPQYSENNMQIITKEMPNATQMAGKAFWEQQGYKLNEDAKGVEIIAPEMDDNGNPVLDENGKQAFTKVTVYDISETNAYETAIRDELNSLRNEYGEERAAAFAQSDTKEIVVSDDLSGKSVTLPADKLTKAQVSVALQENLGYSQAKADIAANKVCRDLGLDREKFFAHTEQYDNINTLRTNIRYQSDDLTLRDMRFDAVNFKDGGTTHIVIHNGDNAVSLTPERMTVSEMKNICINQLGMSEYQAEKAAQKAIKIDKQIKSKMEERTVGKGGVSQSVRIERSSKDTFLVEFGGKSRTYNFNTINVADKIARNFNIPRENALRIVEKAKKQSALQNRIQSTLKKKKAAPEAPKVKLNESKGMKH